ncbi:DEAD/DEAH box helicase family protein [Halorussus pelagicus]|uniref:DEAD/DEAH box helicase family protein n=1 Tax=Halorussus pelagicus TaxID=2505977 RepID=UPI001AA09364
MTDADDETDELDFDDDAPSENRGTDAAEDGEVGNDDDNQTEAETEPVDVESFHDAVEQFGRPVVTAEEVARALDRSQAETDDALAGLAEGEGVERLDVSNDPVVWYPTDWGNLADRERVIVFPKRRELVVDQPTQFTRAQLSQFAHLVDTTRDGGYIYEIRQEDVWAAPFDDFEDLRGTLRDVLPERSPHLEEWMESQWKRARQFVLRTDDEDGYVVLEAASEDLMGNVARQKLDAGQLRAPLSDTESWVAEESVAEVKRILYEAGYPVRDERDLETGEELDVQLNLRLRDYQQEWVNEFVQTKSGVLVGPPGSGKTVAGMGALETVGGETLILVPGRELASQWHDELLAHTTLTPEQIGEYHGGTKDVRPVTIATYQTAGMDRHRQLFDQREWGLIIYDECLSGDTIVETQSGRTTFAELDENFGFDSGWNRDIDLSVRTYLPEDGNYTWTDVQGVYKTESAVQRIETNTGRRLEATPNHTHLVFDPQTGKVEEQKHIEQGDFLVQPHKQTETPSSTSEAADLTKQEARAELMGWFIGDGHLNQYGDVKFSFARRAERQVEILQDLCECLDTEYSVFDNSRGDLTLWAPKLQTELNWTGASGDKASSVTAPKECYCWSKAKIGALLRGLFDAEGSVDKKGRIQFNSVSEQLATDVTLLLQKLGILSRTFEIDRSDEAHNDIYRVTIPSYYGGHFEEQVGFQLQHKAERICGGESPATGLPVGPYLQQLKEDINLTNEEIAEMCDVARVTISDVINGKYRLGQQHLHTLAKSLQRYADEDRGTPQEIRERYNITYSEIAEVADSPQTTVYKRFQREEKATVQTTVDIAKRRRKAARKHADRLEKLDGLMFLEVTDVESIGTKTVYDFETEAHTFLADGFLTHNCHHIPSRVFRRSADLQSKHRLGLSATPVRESDDEEEIFTLIGPPIGTDWDALFDAGYVQEPEVQIRYVPWDDETYRHEYGSAEGHEKRQIAASNPAKVAEIRHLRAEHPHAKTLVFVEYLDQGEELAEALNVPFISGEMRHARREQLLQQFKSGERDALIVSRVGDEGIDLPDAELAIVASGLGGSRRQGAQRAGRTMRPTGNSRMYVLATRGTTEEDFARRRMQHLSAKGVRVTEQGADAVEDRRP